MKKLKRFLVVLLLVLSLSVQLYSQSLSELSDTQLIQMLEMELNKQEKLVNQQKEHLQRLEELNKNLQEQMNNLNNQLEQAEKSLKNSKKDTLINKIIIGSACLFVGAIAGSTIVYINK